MRRRVGVFIPTLDAGPRFGGVLDALAAQVDVDPVIHVIDSGSRDGTLEELERRSIPFESIPRTEFDHGGTRNRGVSGFEEDLVCLLSQDAEPAHPEFLARLAATFDDEVVAGAYALQLPRPGCHPFQRINLARHMGDASARVRRDPLDATAFETMSPLERIERIRFDNVASMVRRQVVERLPFPETSFGEDLAWGRATVLAGFAHVFCPDAAVLHSHPVDVAEFSTRVRQVHLTLKRLTGFVPIPDRRWWLRRTAGTTLRFFRAALADDEVGLPTRIARIASALPWAVIQMEAMYRGGRAVDYEPPT